MANSRSLRLAGFDSQNLCLAANDVGGFAFFAGRGFGPGFLEADVDGGVDDAAVRDFGTREKYEFRLVENTLGWDLRRFVHRA